MMIKTRITSSKREIFSLSLDLLGVLFAEELGLVLEADGSTLQSVLSAYGEHQVDCFTIGTCQPSADNEVCFSDIKLLKLSISFRKISHEYVIKHI